MALLQLPEQARDALPDGKVTVETALELHKLTVVGDVAGEAIAEAVRDLERGQHPQYAISTAKERVRRAAAAEQARADLQVRGIEIVTEQRRAQVAGLFQAVLAEERS